MIIGELDLYDILSVIIPGGLLLLLGLYFQPFLSLRQLNSAGVIGALILAAYTLGHLNQSFSKLIDSEPSKFESKMGEVWEGETENKIDQKFWDLAKDRFDLSEDYGDEDYREKENAGEELLKLVTSDLESSEMTKYSTMQIFSTFYRNMTSLSLIFTFVFTTSVVYNILICTWSDRMLLESFLALVSLVSVILFANQKENFANSFIEYVISDFYSLYSQ